MEFIFDERKTSEAASVLLERHGGAMPYIKLLYLADREALIETGVPITGDRFVSMRFGPVLSRVLDLIKEPDHGEDSIWHSYIARRGYDAVLVGRPGSDHLSEYEEDVRHASPEARYWRTCSPRTRFVAWKGRGCPSGQT